MKTWDILAWTYEADVHCWDCATQRFGEMLSSAMDAEGNRTYPLFVDAVEQKEYCGTCGEIIEGTEMEDDAC